MATLTEKEFAARVSDLHEKATELTRDIAETGWDNLDNHRAVAAYRLCIARADKLAEATGKIAIAMMLEHSEFC